MVDISISRQLKLNFKIVLFGNMKPDRQDTNIMFQDLRIILCSRINMKGSANRPCKAIARSRASSHRVGRTMAPQAAGRANRDSAKLISFHSRHVLRVRVRVRVGRSERKCSHSKCPKFFQTFFITNRHH